MKRLINWANGHRKAVAALSVVAAFLGSASPSFATGSGATYDITPVTSSLTSDLTSNVPVILAVVGSLIALAIAVRMVRKFVRA